MSTLPVRGNRANKPHVRKPYERTQASPSPSPTPQLARTKSSFFTTLRTVLSGWFSGSDTADGNVNRDGGDRHLKRRTSRSKLENGARPKRIRTVSPNRNPAPKTGYLDLPEHMIRPGGSLGRSSKLAVTSDSEQGQLSVRNTPLGFGTYRPPRSPSRRTPSISSWFPQPASTRNSLGPKASQAHFGVHSNLEIDTAIASFDDARMQSRSPSVGVGVGLGRERTPSKPVPPKEASLSLPTGGRTSLSRATGTSSLRVSLSAANPFSSLGKSSSLAPERRKSTLVWNDTVGVTKTKAGKPRAPSAPPAKNTAERLLNALENMHTLTGDAQRPRRRPPTYVQVPVPGPGDRRARIQPYGEVKVAPNKPKKSGESPTKSGLMKMLMKNKKEIQEEDMDMEEETSQSVQPKEAAPSKQISDKAKVIAKEDDMEMESDIAPAAKPATTASTVLKVVDNFRPASQPPSRPSSSLRQSKTITKRAHTSSAGKNRFSANNEEEEEDEEIVEKRNAELLAAANASVFKVPDGFKFGPPTPPAAPKPVQASKAPEVVSPQPISAKLAAPSVLSFTAPVAPSKEAPSFFGSKETPKVAVPEVKNPFASIGSTKPEVKVPEVPKWGSAPSSNAATPPPKPIEGASPFANIGVPAKPAESVPTFSFGKPAEKPTNSNPFASIGKPVAENPFGQVDKPKPVSEKSSAGIGKPAGDNPFAGISASNKGASSATALPFSFGGPKSGNAPASTTPDAAIPSFFSKPAEEPKPAEVPKTTTEPPRSSPFSFGASKPAEKPAASPFSFGAPAAAPASTPAATPAPTSAPAPTPSPFSFGAPSAPVPTPAAPAPTAKPAFSFGLPATTPSPAPSVTETLKNPFDFSAPAAAPAQAEAPKKNPFDFSSASAPSAPAPAPSAPATSQSPFDFSSTAKPADKPASPFAFGATPTPAPVTSATAEKKNPFDFSGSSQKPASSTPFAFGAPPAPASSGFTFGAAPARASTPPSGGDAAMEESPTRDPAPSKIVTSGFGGAGGPAFGSQPPSTGFAFGSNTNGATTTGPFGGPLNGASTTPSNGLASATPPGPSPFAFGASNNASGGFGSAAGSGFGTSGSTAPSSTPFAFGAGGGFGQTPSASASPSNPFSQPQPNPTPFGQSNPTPTNAFPTPASPFPAASPALGTVGFNNSAPPNNAFGSTQPAANGFPGSPATPAFGFGAPNPTVGTASPSTFTFGLPGGTSAPPTPTGTSSPFVFGHGAAPPGPEGSPAPSVQFNLGTAEASPGGRKIKPLRRPRRN